jgi:hypothetical protein
VISWENAARRVRLAGFGLGVLGAIALGVVRGVDTVFLWVPLALLGALMGVIAGEALRPVPLWRVRDLERRPRLSDAISPGLVWAMRISAVLAIALGVSGVPTGSGRGGLLTMVCDAVTGYDQGWQSSAYILPVAGITALGWLAAEIALYRVARRPTAGVEGDDVAVDDALRTASAHVAVAATSVLALAGLGAMAVVLGVTAADGGCGQSDLVVFALIGVGLAALVAALLMTAFLIGWLPQVRRTREAAVSAPPSS